MKAVTVLLAILFSVIVHAEDAAPPADDAAKLQEHKTKAAEMLDKRIAKIQELKSCISGAADHKAMRECRKNHHEDMREMKMEWMEERPGRGKGRK